MTDDAPLSGPQSMIRNNQNRWAEARKAGKTPESYYNEEENGERFNVPVYCHITGPQPEANILRFRVWGNFPELFCQEFTTLDAAKEFHKSLPPADRKKSPILGVVWDNAAGVFAECRVMGLEKEFDPKK